MKCEFCNKEHDGKFGSGRFCSKSCANKYANQFVTKDGRKNQIQALNSKKTRNKIKKTREEKSKQNKNKTKNNVKSDKHNIDKLGEIKTIEKFIEKDIPVYLPIIDNGVDMIAEFNGKPQKIQVKSTSKKDNNTTTFGLTHQTKKLNDGKYKHEKHMYDDNIDYFSLYDAVDDQLFLIKNDKKQKSITIRDNSTTHNNGKGFNLSENNNFDSVLSLIELNIDPEKIIE